MPRPAPVTSATLLSSFIPPLVPSSPLTCARVRLPDRSTLSINPLGAATEPFALSRWATRVWLYRRRRGDLRSSTPRRSEEHTSELQSRQYLVCRLLLETKRN